MNLLVMAAALMLLAALLARILRPTGLPPLIGMIAAGVIVANALPPLPLGLDVPFGAWRLDDIAGGVRQAVLAVVLLRAGLSLSSENLKRAGTLALRLGTLPMFADAALVAVGGYCLLDLSLSVSLVLGFTIAAISPAIVIPGLLDLLKARHGRDRDLPTALLAGATLDNILCLVALGIAVDCALGADGTWAAPLTRLPIDIGASVAMGAALGGLLAIVYRARPQLRAGTPLLWAGAGVLVVAGNVFQTSYVLSIISLGVVIRALAPEAKERLDEGLLSLWSVAQIALFGLIGTALDLEPLAAIGPLSIAAIALGQLGRAAGSLIATARQRFSQRERAAAVLAYIPKATIQAAFGGFALDAGLAEGGLVLSAAILAIVICAPVGLVALHRGAEALLPGGDRAEVASD